VRGDPEALRSRFLATVGPVLADTGFADAVGLEQQGDGWGYGGSLDWSGWDDTLRRSGGEGPDAETLSRVRGDRNRAFLMD
jgi:hypothetical protein